MKISLFQILSSALKFYALGIANFILFLTLFYVMTSILNWHYILASAVSYTIIIISAGLGNVFWVFAHSQKSNVSKARQISRTMSVYVSSLVLELICLFSIRKITNGNVFIIQLIVYIVSSIYCFLMIHYVLFREKKLSKE